MLSYGGIHAPELTADHELHTAHTESSVLTHCESGDALWAGDRKQVVGDLFVSSQGFPKRSTAFGLFASEAEGCSSTSGLLEGFPLAVKPVKIWILKVSKTFELAKVLFRLVGDAHRAERVVDAAQAVVGLEQQQQRAGHAAEQVADLDRKALRDVCGGLPLRLAVLQPQVVRRRVRYLHVTQR